MRMSHSDYLLTFEFEFVFEFEFEFEFQFEFKFDQILRGKTKYSNIKLSCSLTVAHLHSGHNGVKKLLKKQLRFFFFILQFHQALVKCDFIKILTKLCWALGQSPLARKKALRGHFEAVSCIIELEVHWPFHPVRHYLSENRAVGIQGPLGQENMIRIYIVRIILTAIYVGQNFSGLNYVKGASSFGILHKP